MNKALNILRIMAAAAFIASCSEQAQYDDYGTELAARAPERDDVAADAAADLASSTYENEGAAYGCTDDCSGHEAGWEWAAQNNVTDASDCGGNSVSFEEGCQAFAEAVEARTDAHMAEYD